MNLDVTKIADRVKIVNLIIEKISSLDRGFFKHDDKTNYFLVVGKKVYMFDTYLSKKVLLNNKHNISPKEFLFGGTLWGLSQDFRDFIITGQKTNGENGYGGLYCPHWGYKQESMHEIQELAKSLNYL